VYPASRPSKTIIWVSDCVFFPTKRLIGDVLSPDVDPAVALVATPLIVADVKGPLAGTGSRASVLLALTADQYTVEASSLRVTIAVAVVWVTAVSSNETMEDAVVSQAGNPQVRLSSIGSTHGTTFPPLVTKRVRFSTTLVPHLIPSPPAGWTTQPPSTTVLRP